MPRPDKHQDLAPVRRQAAEGGLTLDQHHDVKRELLERTLQSRGASAAEGGGVPAEEVMARLRNSTEGPRAEPAVWDKALDRSLFPEDSST